MKTKAHLAGRRTVARDTAAFTWKLDEPLSFQPGQTCDWTLPGALYTDERGNARTFSIASSPKDMPSIVIATRLTGSAFKRSLMDGPMGLEIEVDGPYGSFTLHQNATRPALLLAGGIGITPFRSIIKDAAERRLPHRIALLYSNRTRESAAFLDELTGWARESRNLTIVPVFTEETGFIDAAAIRRHQPEIDKTIAYAAGPEVFVTAMRQALLDSGADPDNIRTEDFPGY